MEKSSNCDMNLQLNTVLIGETAYYVYGLLVKYNN